MDVLSSKNSLYLKPVSRKRLAAYKATLGSDYKSVVKKWVNRVDGENRGQIADLLLNADQNRDKEFHIRHATITELPPLPGNVSTLIVEDCNELVIFSLGESSLTKLTIINCQRFTTITGNFPYGLKVVCHNPTFFISDRAYGTGDEALYSSQDQEQSVGGLARHSTISAVPGFCENRPVESIQQNSELIKKFLKSKVLVEFCSLSTKYPNEFFNAELKLAAMQDYFLKMWESSEYPFSLAREQLNLIEHMYLNPDLLEFCLVFTPTLPSDDYETVFANYRKSEEEILFIKRNKPEISELSTVKDKFLNHSLLSWVNDVSANSNERREREKVRYQIRSVNDMELHQFTLSNSIITELPPLSRQFRSLEIDRCNELETLNLASSQLAEVTVKGCAKLATISVPCDIPAFNLKIDSCFALKKLTSEPPVARRHNKIRYPTLAQNQHKKMPSVITVEPFSGKPSDERIAEVLEEVLDYGKEKYQEEARFALIKSCRNREVPESTRREAESFLVRFLKKKYPIEHCAGCYCEGEFDTKQFIAQSIQALFIEKLKKVALIIEKEQALYFQRLRDRHLSDSERVLTEWGCKYVAKEQIRIYLPEFQPHYLYLKDLVEHIDDQLFDEATVLLMEGRLQVAAIIYQMLAESTNRYFPSKEKLFREMPFRFEEITPVFLAYLAEAVAMHPLPKTAYCLGKLYLRFLNYPEAYPKLIIGSDSLHGVVPRNVRRKCNETAIANFAIAAEYGYDLAISAIRRLDEESIDPDILRALSDLSSRGEIVGLSYNRPEKLKRKSAKIRKDIILERRLNALSTEQKILFGIDENTTLEARIELANPWLENGKWGNGFSFGSDKNEVLKAVVVLSAISKVKHPTASKAQKILDTWLSIRENRIWLVKQYGIEPSIPKVKESFSEQVNILLKQIQAYKDQQDFKAVEHLVYQLIDVGIELEFSKKSIHQEVMCPLFYQILIDHPGVGDKYKHELRARGAILGGKVNDRDALLCLINAASIEGRPNASYQVGRRYLPYYYYMDNKLFIYDLIEDEETAKGIEKAIYYFQKAKEEGCLLLHRELDMLSDVILATHEAARKSLEKHRNRRFLDTDKEDLLEAIHLYKLAGLAGDREATFSYLSLSLSETNDSVVQFQLANLYLTGLNTPYPKQDVPRAQELLESSAKNGYAEAAFLLAHHYSPHTSHVPKLRSSDPHAASLRFLEMANKQGRLDTQWALLNREQAFANLEKENYPAALFYLLSLTQEDDATVYFQLGDMHLKGLGMKYQNFEKAIHFYRKADEKNHFLAPFMIAQSYLEKANSSVLGTINGDFDRAFDGFKQISEKKEAKDNYYGEASYLIATVFKWKLNASEVPVYLKKAYEQGYTRAREDIFVLSEQFRQNVEKCTFKNDVELALADELLQFSADAKYLKAQHKLEALKRAGNNEVKELA